MAPSTLSLHPVRAALRPGVRLDPPVSSSGVVDVLHVIHLSFEGPDAYAHAGGLAVRVTTMAQSLASLGHLVDLYFVGDPAAPTVEHRRGVTLHRWSQSISSAAPHGVYDGEEDKIADWCTSLPPHLADVVAEDAAAGRRTMILAEDWHTAWPLICLHDELVRRRLRHHPVLAWTANNRFGFERIDFGRLDRAALILTISKAMKHLMWGYGVNPRVVPNGLDPSWIDGDVCGRAGGGTADLARRLRRVLVGRTVLTKVGRWDPDKRWLMALHAVADLADRGRPTVLLARGWNGSPTASAHARELKEAAARRGLPWITVADGGPEGCRLPEALADAGIPANAVVELSFPVAGASLAGLYRGADAVLANSGFEPFGLVGLEAMAAGAIVVTGSTGEDYLRPFHNGFALDTDDPSEIIGCLDWLGRDPARARSLRSAARRTAAAYSWPAVLERLLLSTASA